MEFHWHKNYIAVNEAIDLSDAKQKINHIRFIEYETINGIGAYSVNPNATKEELLNAAQIIIDFANSLEGCE